MPFGFRTHPIYGMPFDAPVYNTLREHYERMPLSRRSAAWRKALQRELLLRLLGQAPLRVAQVPADTRRLLWVYTWETIGDSIMDLAVRQALPPALQIDLCISPALAPLYAQETRWRRVITGVEECEGPYDFVLLQDLGTSSLKLKIRADRRARFATVFEHLRGEHWDRMAFTQRRFEQLFGLPVAAPSRPFLEHGPRRAHGLPLTRIALALGARDPRRRYRRWSEVVRSLLASWPAQLSPPEFVLLGNAPAFEDLNRFPPALLAQHCRIEVDRLDLLGTACLIRDCDAFLGVDGGLMHIAVAHDLPGLALFVEIEPAMRLLPRTRLRSLFRPEGIDQTDPDQVARELLAAVQDRRLADT